MIVPTIAFFNNKGGVGKTTLVYHVASMIGRLGLRVLCADLDPQANLTAMFLDEERLEEIFDDSAFRTIYGAISPIVRGVGDIADADVMSASVEEPEVANGDVGLVAGDLELARFETDLAQAWPMAVDRRPAAVRTTTSLARIVMRAAETFRADVVLLDVGPNLGAVNRAALIAADHIVVPMAPDLFSLRGLRNLGPTVRSWREEWEDRRQRSLSLDVAELPNGVMRPIGYVVLQHAIRLDRPVIAYGKWMRRIPEIYATYVDQTDASHGITDVRNDPNCLASLKNYRSLMPLAQEARKPMFALKVADGALGSQQNAVRHCYEDFRMLTQSILERVGVNVPASA